MRKLLIPQTVFDRLRALILETPEGLETGVTLFGTSVSIPDADVVLAVAGPGRRATHEPAHYSGDENHANAIFDALQCALPGIEWQGEFHVHPRGMTWLSHGDVRTVCEILTGRDDTLHPEAFIAGVLQRKNRSVVIYPYRFTRERLKGDVMELQIVATDAPAVHQARLKGVQNARSSVCTKSEGSRTAQHKTSRHHWLRLWWQRLSRYGRKVRDRQTDAR